MDDETKLQIVDRLLERTQASVLASLAATIDTEQELGELYGEIRTESGTAARTPVQN